MITAEKKEYILFATNKDVKSIEEFEKSIPEEYKKRWNIETGYRVKNDFIGHRLRLEKSFLLSFLYNLNILNSYNGTSVAHYS
jgi:hypothetical protein